MTIRHFAIISALALFTGMMAIPNGNRRGMDQQSFFSDTTITTVTPNTNEVTIPDGSVAVSYTHLTLPTTPYV